MKNKKPRAGRREVCKLRLKRFAYVNPTPDRTTMIVVVVVVVVVVARRAFVIVDTAYQSGWRAVKRPSVKIRRYVLTDEAIRTSSFCESSPTSAK